MTSGGGSETRSGSRKPKRAERRQVTPGSLTQVIVAAKRDYEQAKARFESIAVILGCHTLWEHSDGRDLCDHDGQPWPCSTVSGLAFVYGVVVPEQWERDTSAGGSGASR